MRQQRGLWPAVAVSLLGHAIALTYVQQPESAAPGNGAARPLAFEVAIRPAGPLLSLEAAEPSRIEPVASLPKDASPIESRSIPGPVPSERRLPGGEQRPASAAPEADAPYLPRAQLTVPARIMGSAHVPFPDEVVGVVDLKVQLTLFIDESGKVQRVRIDTANVHSAFEKAIRDTFSEARFSPGEVNQVPVRSQMRLEVEFSAPRGLPRG